MESLVRVQTELHNSIKKGFTNYKKSPKERLIKEYVEARLENLERDWSLFRSNHTKLYEISKLEELEMSSYVTKELYDSTEDDYLMYKASMRSMLNKIEAFVTKVQPAKDDANDKPSTNLVKLPKISIPTFSGIYSEWTTFRDLFKSLIHNNKSLSNVQKLHYLKTHLTGEAEQLVRYTPITDSNYTQCWSLLEKRYDNKKYLANCILKRLFGQKRMFYESSSGIKELLDTTMDCLNALKNINIDVSTWDIIIIHIVTFKLDAETRKQWELHISNIDANKLPTLDQFRDFMESRFRALEYVDTKSTQQSSGSQAKPKVMVSTNVSVMRCEFCSEGHKLCFCKQFVKLELGERRDFVSKNRMCFNCLGSNHTVYDCKKVMSCKICNKRHHTLLHYENYKSVPSSTNENGDGAGPSTTNNPVVSCLSTRKIGKYGQVLLATALVQAKSEVCGPQIIRALIDQGSQACFITEATVQLLRLKKETVSGTISGLGGDKGLMFKHVVTIQLQSRVDKNFNIQFKAYVLKNLTSQLPERKVQVINWMELEQLQLADPHFDTPTKIDLLLGADVYSTIIKDGLKKSPDGALIAQDTTLGWILSGKIIKLDQGEQNQKISVHHAQVNVKDILKQFWEIEEQFASTKVMLTEEEQKCENIFNSTIKRTDEGRYIVKLPFRDPQPRCVGGGSREIAVKKFKSLERRLAKDLELKKSYVDVINEYLQLGHMRPVKKEDQNKAVYLPHHAVVRSDKATTKVRVVFNASSKNCYGISLNDTLLVGPKLQADLRHLVMRWREYPIVIVADIIKMYRQVRISEDDAIFQRIVWRENPENEIGDFELMTVTFGTASAPYLAVKALNQVSLDEGQQFPIAAPRVIQSFYMDDLMTGVGEISEGLELYKQMTQLLLKGGFELQKWNSNNEKLLEEISKLEGVSSKSKQEDSIQDKIIKEEQTQYIAKNKEIDTKAENITKILGITWDRSEDCFRYSVNLSTVTPGPETKRSILSVIARLYDPLGWLAPSVIIAKMFIQKLWLEGKDWDEPISTVLGMEWNTYRNFLPKLTSVRIPRWLGTLNTENVRELHGFCDASKSAYAAVVYLRVVDDSGNVHVSLLASKTRVAPIKQISIPRLELCGSTLLARLLTEIAEVMNIPKNNIKAWTDSTIVLAWLSSHPSRWKTFVANRVSEILSALDSSQWYHVTSKENPADCASRGVQPDALADNELWFSGPRYLREQKIVYSKPRDLKISLEEVVKSHFTTTSMPEDQMLQRFSSLSRLLRVIAYCRRFYRRDNKSTTYLKKTEINGALVCCIKKVQREEFCEDYCGLQFGEKLICKNTKLKALCPYVDENGIMRASGRLQKSQLAEETKNPIILPHNSHLTKLIILDAHLKTLHGGTQLMLNYLRDSYWIIGVRSLVRQHVRKCVVCVRQNAKVQNQIMGQLPSVRCTPARAFFHSGVDYAGPIKVRTTKGRGHHSYKCYICLFICMATRAIHLEVVSDMSTQAFIAAFRRFVSRRGHCSQLWSDNGTTFVGASKELKSIQQDVAAYVATHGTEWHFIPPHAPNFGGLWEAGVKSTKYHLKRVLGEATLTFEEITTLLTQVEACLNSRPITVDNSDPNDPRPLTPGHFLIGGPLVAVPDMFDYTETNISSLTRWQYIQRMLQSFWRRWSQEYLSNLMHRYKWNTQIPEPAIGDIVLIKEDDLPPSRWLMGRVEDKHPGSDNVTRVVTVRVKSTLLKRPTSKLCILPVNDD